MPDANASTHNLSGSHNLSDRHTDDLSEERLALWARWEQVNFGLYQLSKLRGEQPEVDPVLLHERLWQELQEIEADLGVSSPAFPPFSQDTAVCES